MRPLVKPFLLGFVAFALVVSSAAVALGIVAEENGWESTRIALGPLELVAFERARGATSMSFGPGLAVLALVGGVLNALAAALVRRRAATSELGRSRTP